MPYRNVNFGKHKCDMPREHKNNEKLKNQVLASVACKEK